MFGSKKKTAINQYADLMVDVVAGLHDDDIEAEGLRPMFGHRNDLAYLQGYRAIERLKLSTFGTRHLIRRFKSGLSNRGLASREVDIHVAQFWVHYWTMMVGSTAEIGGIAHRLTLKKVRQSQHALDRIERQ
jgi:hypothetical protein